LPIKEDLDVLKNILLGLLSGMNPRGGYWGIARRR